MGSQSSKVRLPRRPVFYLTTFDSTLPGRGRSFRGARVLPQCETRAHCMWPVCGHVPISRHTNFPLLDSLSTALLDFMIQF